MTFPSRCWSAILAATLLPVAAFAAEKPATGHPTVLAYYEYSGSGDSLHANAKYLTEISTDTFGVDINGVVSGLAPKDDLAFARSKGMLTFAAVSNFGISDFDPEIAHAVLTDPVVQARALRTMMKVVRDFDYSGINIDFEAVPAKDRSAYTAFISAVKKKMKNAGRLTMVSVPAETADDPGDSWVGAFHYAALGKIVDIFQLMTYDENGPWGPPGPVAGLDWVEACVQFTVSVMPSAKVSLGMPAYGYDWDLTHNTGVQVSWRAIPSLISRYSAVPQWDATTSSPYFTYQGQFGADHVVWYEDATSIPLKSALVRAYGLAGVSVFALGKDDHDYWQAVYSSF